MCSQGYVWQSQRCDSYQKGVPSWGGMRGSGPSTHPSGEVLAWLLLPKRVINCQLLYVWKIFLRGGTKSIIVYWLALGMECRVVSSGTQQFDMPSERASWYALPGAICALSKAISGCTASTCPHRSLGLQWWAIPPYFCLISTSKLLPLLALQLLTPQSEFVFRLAFDKSSKAIDYNWANALLQMEA